MLFIKEKLYQNSCAYDYKQCSAKLFVQIQQLHKQLRTDVKLIIFTCKISNDSLHFRLF